MHINVWCYLKTITRVNSLHPVISCRFIIYKRKQGYRCQGGVENTFEQETKPYCQQVNISILDKMVSEVQNILKAMKIYNKKTEVLNSLQIWHNISVLTRQRLVIFWFKEIVSFKWYIPHLLYGNVDFFLFVYLYMTYIWSFKVTLMGTDQHLNFWLCPFPPLSAWWGCAFVQVCKCVGVRLRSNNGTVKITR